LGVAQQFGEFGLKAGIPRRTQEAQDNPASGGDLLTERAVRYQRRFEPWHWVAKDDLAAL